MPWSLRGRALSAHSPLNLYKPPPPSRAVAREKPIYVFVYIHNPMPTRTIGLSEDAYQRLAAAKQEGESFSDVVRRLTGATLLMKLAGTMDPETAHGYRRAIAAGRRRENAARTRRSRRMLD